MIPTTVRVVCMNTLNLALGCAAASDGLSILHTESLQRRVVEARSKLGLILGAWTPSPSRCKCWVRKSPTQAELTNFFTALCEDRAEKSQRRLLEKFAHHFEDKTNTLPGIRGTAWAAFNAISGYADHEMTVHGQGTVRADNRLCSLWFGAANALKQDAWQAALAMAS